MSLDKNDLKIEYMRGTGPGGQHKNKTNSACKITHVPTGISAYCDERNQKTSYRNAMKELESRIKDAKAQVKADEKKARRDHAIHNTATIRTYDFKAGVVRDHRSGKTASLKEVLEKGKIDLLRGDSKKA
jgi:peptide chain release factor 1